MDDHEDFIILEDVATNLDVVIEIFPTEIDNVPTPEDLIEAILEDSPSPSPINRKNKRKNSNQDSNPGKKSRKDPQTVPVEPLNLDQTQFFDESMRSQNDEN